VTRVIHTGDTHIGYAQYHSPERRADFLAAFRSVIEDATAEGVDAVVHAGDLFHDRRPDLRDVLGTVSALRELGAAGIPFLAVVGNHEGTRDAQWLDLFERLGLAVRLDWEGERVGDTVFYGLDHVPRAKRSELEYDFAERDAEHTALVGHGLFSPLASYGDWDLAAVLAASPVAFDAVLLGDDHQPDRAEVAGAWATYCGSTERASAEERADRGYNIVEFDDEVHITRRGLDTRRFVFVDVDLGPGEGTERVRSRLREESLDDAVVVVTVEGEGEEVVPAEVERFGAEAGALVTRVNDRREREAEANETEVRFADPDEAVRDRLGELDVSPAVHDIDATVRDTEGTPDSRVRESVERLVTDRLEEDPAALLAATGEAGTDARTGGEEESRGDGQPTMEDYL
jgi:DNA repair exonuclease SbcCD nuclease subunit